MDIELLVVPGCPNEATAARLLRAALADLGLVDVGFTTTVIATQAEAERREFLGSPTFLVAGSDPFAEPGRPAGLSCRVYRRTDGVGGVPDLPELRRALERAAERSE